jgi:hypothetical protein
MLKWQARSSVVEHCFDVAGVSGSIPLAPTSNKKTIVLEIYKSMDITKSMLIRFV